MYAVLVNALAIVAGGAVGLVLRGGISERFKGIISNSLALCVVLIGVSGAIKTGDMMLVIVCLVLGSILGEWIGIESGLERLGDMAQARFAGGDDGSFARGFVSSTLLFCVGAMAVVGSLDAGLTGNGATLMAKSALDGVSSIIFASSMGPGVLLSALPVLVYQGLIALLASAVHGLLPDAVIAEMAAVGGMLILGLGLNMLGVMREGRIKVGNMLPAMFLPILYIPLTQLLQQFMWR